MNEFTFDKWDYQLILTTKRYIDRTDLYDLLLNLWCERNAADKEYMHPQYIVHRMSEIVDWLYQTTKYSRYSTINILEESAPSKDWMYPQMKNGFKELVYWERLMYTYASLLRFVDVKHIPGLDGYFNNVWLKEGKP